MNNKQVITEIADNINGIKVIQDENETLNALLQGDSVARFEYGDSMKPILVSGEYCILSPIDVEDVKVGDAVFCKVNGYLMTHMVWMISNSSANGRQFLIGSSGGQLYGWTTEVYAIAYGTNIVQESPNYAVDMEIIDRI